MLLRSYLLTKLPPYPLALLRRRKGKLDHVGSNPSGGAMLIMLLQLFITILIWFCGIIFGWNLAKRTKENTPPSSNGRMPDSDSGRRRSNRLGGT